MRNNPIRPALYLSLLLCGGCPSEPAKPDAGEVPPEYSGGTVPLARCGYPVTTREGATPPVEGRPMLGPDPTPWAIHLGFAGDPATSMVVSWRTRDETTLATTVQYGVVDPAEQSADGLTFAYLVWNGNLPDVRIHETHLCGLKPGTQYRYRVGGRDAEGKEAWSPIYSFRTAPRPDDPLAQIVVGVIGDTRLNYPMWGQLVAALNTTAAPDVILFTGDAVYLGQLQNEWDEWFKQAEPVLRSVPIIPAHGNHENNAVNYFSQFALPGNEEYFGFDYGPMHVTVVNDSTPDLTDLETIGKPFLDGDLGRARKPWRFVVHHKPMYSELGGGHGSDLSVRAAWAPTIDKHRVDAVFNGHDHRYGRTKPLRGDQPQAGPADGTIYFIVGSAGADLYELGTPEAFSEVSKATYNFAVLRLRANLFDFKAYDDKAAVIDTLMITK